PNLRVLRLSYNHDLGDGLWQESAILQALTQTRIEKLHLEHTSLAETSLQALLGTVNKTHLTDLYVNRAEGYRITQGFVDAYTQKPPYTNLDGKPFTVHFGE
ncbi:MAG: hypothetical protein ACRCYZ_03990, partial [Alphaproteobacteria bacterium]